MASGKKFYPLQFDHALPGFSSICMTHCVVTYSRLRSRAVVVLCAVLDLEHRMRTTTSVPSMLWCMARMGNSCINKPEAIYNLFYDVMGHAHTLYNYSM